MQFELCCVWNCVYCSKTRSFYFYLVYIVLFFKSYKSCYYVFTGTNCSIEGNREDSLWLGRNKIRYVILIIDLGRGHNTALRRRIAKTTSHSRLYLASAHRKFPRCVLGRRMFFRVVASPYRFSRKLFNFSNNLSSQKW